MSNFNIDSVFSEYVLKASQGIRNGKLLLDNHTIFEYVTKNFATSADASLIDTTIQILLTIETDLPIKATPSLLSINLVTLMKLAVRKRQTTLKL